MDILIACVEDLVQETELSSPELWTAIDRYNKEIIINFTELKYNKKCNGAHVFKYLFKLSNKKTDPWKDTDMEKDEQNRITILYSLGISKEEWEQFLYFLRHPHPPYFCAWLTTHENHNNAIREGYYNKVVIWLEDINVICNKFGGFPEFDKYYEKFWQGNIANGAFGTSVPPNLQNKPTKPEEDIHDKYLWENFRRGSPRHNLFTTSPVPTVKNWSVASIIRRAAGPDNLWYRRLK